MLILSLQGPLLIATVCLTGDTNPATAAPRPVVRGLQLDGSSGQATTGRGGAVGSPDPPSPAPSFGPGSPGGQSHGDGNMPGLGDGDGASPFMHSALYCKLHGLRCRAQCQYKSPFQQHEEPASPPMVPSHSMPTPHP